MKTRFTNFDSTRSSTDPVGTLTGSSLVTRHSSRREGFALVITLILLSVTLVMAIAFLAISRRERGSVTTTTDTATAQFAADAALASAEARITSQLLTTANPYVFSLLVSTNYINQVGFTNTTTPEANLLNVNYDHYANSSTPLSSQDFIQNVANLYYSPRPPVFYGSNDFRFYLDLNRNGRYDTNGVVTNYDNNLNGLGTTSVQVGDPEWIGVLEHPDQPHGPNNPFIARYCFIAVPANSLDLNHIHNQALEAPLGSTVNPPSTTRDAYSRDQGVGTWEINLAAFLTDLDTNRWDPNTLDPWNSLNEPYAYPELLPGVDSVAFDDARALIAWRYNNTYPLLANADGLFGGPPFQRGDFAFKNGGVDYYTLGQQTSFDTNFDGYGNPTKPWVGAESTNNFFSSPSELFNTNQTSAQFATNLVFAGLNNSTYDRYTFYRMLAQLGTDTQPTPGKLNINYQNAILSYVTNLSGIVTPASITIVPNMETNFVSWQPQDFFTAAANQLLKAYTAQWFESAPSNYFLTYYGLNTNYSYISPNYSYISGNDLTNYPVLGLTNQIPSFGITNIPVYVNGSFVYTPAVNRLLQLAANIYDSTTNTSDSPNYNYPSVFRPIFWKTNEYNSFGEPFTNVYIKGYQYVQEPVTTNGNPIFITPMEVNDPNLPYGLSISNVWGVPWIVGAKKGLPNFNAFELDNIFFIQRLLEFNRNINTVDSIASDPFPYGRIYTTNQMYIMGISNSFAMNDWNSYAESYNNPVIIVAQDLLSVGLTNNAGFSVVNDFTNTTSYLMNSWAAQTYILPFGTNQCVMQNLSFSPSPASTNNLYAYYYGSTPQPPLGGINFVGPCFIPTSLDPSNFLDTGTPPLPQFGLVATNHLQAYMLDTHDPNGSYILDYVQLGGMNSSLNINQAIADPNSDVTQNGEKGGLWSTNTDWGGGGNTPSGVDAQYLVSAWDESVPSPEDSDQGASATLGWSQASIPGGGNNNSPIAQATYFAAFFSPGNSATIDGETLTNWETSIQAPFTPMRQILQRFVFQANDPLVHYMTSDLNDFPDDSSTNIALATPPPGIKYIGLPSDRYMPWGQQGNMNSQILYVGLNALNADNNYYNLSYKDPLVESSDNWDFPTNKFPSVGWLGRVHRGTPWQTVFLKSTNIMSLGTLTSSGYNGEATWYYWTGNPSFYDSSNAAPVQDRLLFDLFTATPDDDATRGQLSVNIGADDPNNPLAGLASWSALLSGTLTFSNNANDTQYQYAKGSVQDPIPGQTPPVYTLWTNQPLGAPPYPGGSPTNSALWKIVEGINNTRTNFVAVDGLQGVFEHVGDILATPQLSDASPFLNSADTVQQQKDISDEMYEWLPQQVMGLLDVSGTPQNPPRYVVYCYGQSLKPVPNGIVETGSFAGMCTNYQVVSESAARAIIHVENAPTPENPNTTPHVVVEQFNPLPPN